VLAYLFWHRPAPGVDLAKYEAAHRAFHRALGSASAAFRLAELPFEGGAGYEDWYLVDDWAGLGALNAAAVEGRRRSDHDRIAAIAGSGWGAVYTLLRGEESIPTEARWLDKPRSDSYEDFVASLPETTIWQRQLTLGPAPEFCLAEASTSSREILPR
jgi:hypothetical protein